jgi:dihydroneopterin aldolase
MGDAIVVRGIRAEGRHGLPGERDLPQPYIVDVEIRGDLGAAAGADRLEDTIDYSDVICEVRDVIESNSYELLERLALEVAERVHELGAGWVRVRVAKPRAAESLGVDEIAVIIER